MKRLSLTIVALLLAAGPASAQFNTRGTQSYRNALTSNNEFGLPRFTTTLLPTCAANNLGAKAWDTTTSEEKVCNGSSWAVVGGTAAIDACPQTAAHSICKGDSTLVFEGATANDFETTITVTDPTADRTVTFPNLTGDVVVTAGAQTIAGTKSFSGLAGTNNEIIGAGAGAALAGDSDHNTCFGDQACDTLVDGNDNVVIGSGADIIDTTSTNAVAVGSGAKAEDDSVSVGFQAGASLVSGADNNTLIGYQAGTLLDNGGADGNTFVGYQAGAAANAVSANNTCLGDLACDGLTTGDGNVIIGADSDVVVATESNTIAIGTGAIASTTGGVTIGYQAGDNQNSGATKNTLVGYRAGSSVSGNDDWTVLGYEACDAEAGVSAVVCIGSSTEVTGANGVAVGQNANAADGVSIGGGTGNSSGAADVDNVWIGFNAAVSATGTSTDNTCLGDLSCATLTTGDGNVIIGADSDLVTAVASNVIAIGFGAKAGDVGGMSIGYQAGDSLVAGANRNTLIGFSAGTGLNDAAADDNVLVGYNVSVGLTTSSKATVVGASAGSPVSTPSEFVVVGYSAFVKGSQAVAVGSNAEAGPGGISIGYQSGLAIGTNDVDNVFVGMQTGLLINGTATDNTFVGDLSGDAATTGDRNVLLGANTDLGTVTDSDVTVVGESMVTPAADSILIGFGGQQYMYVHGAGKVITDAVATPIVDISVADDTAGGATIEYTVTAVDTDEYQAERGAVYIAWENDSATESCSIGEISTTVLAGSGSMAVTNACTVGLTDEVRWTFTADSSLGAPATTVTLYWSIRIDGPATTVTPQ